MLTIGPDEISSVLTYPVCVDAMRDAMMRLSQGDTEQMLRQILPLDRGRMFGIMAGTMGAGSAFGSKLICVTPERADTAIPSHQGVVVLFDPDTGATACVADAGAITAIRTASASALATNVLAREESRTLTILGTGEQAWHHALAIASVRTLSEVRFWGRSIHKAERLAAELLERTGLPARALAGVQEAVREADIICTVTAASDPVLLNDWVAPGTHINVVGSSYDGPREIDDALVARARFFADSSASVRAQGAEFRHALNAGTVGPGHLLGEIGEVLLGKIPGRQSALDVTIYKSLGHIVQDIAAAEFVYNKLKAPGV